jgi:hypothetical protein
LTPGAVRARHEADTDRRCHLRADDDFALALGQDLPAQRLSPEPGEPRQVVCIDHDVMQR